MTKSELRALALNVKQTWDRVYSTLLSAARQSGNRHECARLPELTPTERIEHITKHWGPTALIKVKPFLERIASIEETAAGEMT